MPAHYINQILGVSGSKYVCPIDGQMSDLSQVLMITYLIFEGITFSGVTYRFKNSGLIMRDLILPQLP